MQYSNKRKKILFTIILTTLAVTSFLYVKDSYLSNKTEETYSQFHAQVQDKKIESALIKENNIYYWKKNNPEKEYCTQNPQSPVLKEFLLINDVKVEEEEDISQIINLLLDIIFYVFFFGVIFFVFRKFISPNTFKVVKKTGISFKDVIGMDELKSYMLKVIDIMKNPDKYKALGIRMPKGILMEGEPGNGKTFFAKALAGQAKINFIPAKATDFESMFMAIGPMKVKMLFRKARRKAPCIVFIDEFDGIGTHRNYSGNAIETENTRIVTALLNELDGFEQTNGVLVLAATNSIQALDKALIRPGRFDTRVSVPYPQEKERIELVKKYLGSKEIEKNYSPQTLAQMFKGFSCARIESVINRAIINSQAENPEQKIISLSSVESAIKETERNY